MLLWLDLEPKLNPANVSHQLSDMLDQNAPHNFEICKGEAHFTT